MDTALALASDMEWAWAAASVSGMAVAWGDSALCLRSRSYCKRVAAAGVAVAESDGIEAAPADNCRLTETQMRPLETGPEEIPLRRCRSGTTGFLSEVGGPLPGKQPTRYPGRQQR